MKLHAYAVPALLLALGAPTSVAQSQPSTHSIVLHAARLLDIKNGRILKPGEVLVQGERIVEAGTSVKRNRQESRHFSPIKKG